MFRCQCSCPCSQVFKEHNTAWPRTEVVMTDKDMGEHRELAAAFPAATMQLCLFHTLRSFSRELTQEKMGVRAGLRDALLTVFNGMASARSEEFEQQCAALADLDIPAASQYFERHWLPIKEQWVSFFKSRHFTLGEQTNNRLESLNGKIKSVCSRYSSLDVFFADFFCVLRVLRGERSHASIIARVSKLTSLSPELTDDAECYRQLLTPYACQLVVEQLARRVLVTLPASGAPFMSSEGPLFVTDSSCDCAFRCTRRLPCRHMFAQRLCQPSALRLPTTGGWPAVRTSPSLRPTG